MNPNESTDPWDQLNKRLDVDPNAGWDPKPGERLVGRLTGIEYRKTRRGSRLPILTIETADGQTVNVAAGRRVLVARLVEQRVQPGDLLGIQYDGQVTPAGGGNPYYGYRVAVQHNGDRGPDVFRNPEDIPDDDGDDLGLTDTATIGDPWPETPASSLQQSEEVSF